MGKTFLCQRSFLFPCATGISMAFSASSPLFSAVAAKANFCLLMKGVLPLIHHLPSEINICFQ